MSKKFISSELLEEEPELIDLIDRFVARLPSMQEAILEDFEAKNWQTFIDLVHQMKGVAGNYGYPMLTALCAEIELSSNNKEYAKVTEQLIEFKLLSEHILAGSDANHRIAKK